MEVDTQYTDGTLIVTLGGDWTMEHPLPRFEPLLDGSLRNGSLRNGSLRDARAVAFDTAPLGTWDSSLLTFLLDGLAYCEEHAITFRQDTLPESIANLLTLSQAVPEQEISRDKPPASFLASLGYAAFDVFDELVAFVTFTGEFTTSLFRVATRRARMRWRDFGVVLETSGASALPIVTLISFLVGLIISFLAAVVLRRFGADYYVSYLVSYGMLRELGALMTAIIMAGRTGAAFAAEIGSMKITEEIDALKTLGISPVDFLVLPRVLAIFLMMPLLTVYADFVGIIGGWTVAVSMLDVSTVQFFTGLLEPVTLNDALLGIFKGTVYGLIIGLAGCLRGTQTGNDAAAVGDAATSAVVTGITLIILANAVIDWAAAILQI